jgi:8-oxo-dGTP diphosphatase
MSEDRVWRDRTTTGIVLLNQAGQVLMQLRDDIPTIADPGCWVIPGGETSSDEDPAAGARREFLEETGYRIEPADLHFVLERDLDRPQGAVERQYYYLARYDGAQPLTCYEGQDLRFMDLMTIPALKTSPGLKEIIRVSVERFGSG